MKPELAAKADETIEILQNNFDNNQLSDTIIPMLSGTRKSLFADDVDGQGNRKQTKVAKVEELVDLLMTHFTQTELDEYVIPRLVQKEGKEEEKEEKPKAPVFSMAVSEEKDEVVESPPTKKSVPVPSFSFG